MRSIDQPPTPTSACLLTPNPDFPSSLVNIDYKHDWHSQVNGNNLCSDIYYDDGASLLSSITNLEDDFEDCNYEKLDYANVEPTQKAESSIKIQLIKPVIPAKFQTLQNQSDEILYVEEKAKTNLKDFSTFLNNEEVKNSTTRFYKGNNQFQGCKNFNKAGGNYNSIERFFNCNSNMGEKRSNSRDKWGENKKETSLSCRKELHLVFADENHDRESLSSLGEEPKKRPVTARSSNAGNKVNKVCSLLCP